MDFDFDFEFDTKTIAAIVIILIIVIAGAWWVMSHHHNKNQQNQQQQAQQTNTFDFVASPLPDYMTIMTGKIQNNTLKMPLGATKLYASGSIFTYQYDGQNVNIIGSTIASLFISGELSSPSYILFTGSDTDGPFLESYFIVNSTQFLVVKNNQGDNVFTDEYPSNIPVDTELFNYTGANGGITVISNETFVHVSKTENGTIYDWFFGNDRIVYQVSHVDNGTTYETTMYIQVEAPDDMWGDQPLG